MIRSFASGLLFVGGLGREGPGGRLAERGGAEVEDPAERPGDHLVQFKQQPFD